MEQEHTRLSLGVGVAGLALLAAHQTILLQSYPLAVQPPSSGAWGVWLLHTLGHSLLYLQETCWHQAPGMVQLQNLFHVIMTGVPFGSSQMCSV